MQSLSRVMPIGYDNSKCGYCGNKSASFSYYAAAVSLTPEFYQYLLDRGWRRSGDMLYKPDLLASCCPQYTVRLDSSSYKPTKDQRQTLNRFNKYILGDSYTKAAAQLYPRSREQAKKRNTDFDLRERVHESESVNLQTPPEPSHSFVVTIETNEFTEEKYALFENYQRKVHHEPPNRITRSGFKSFLCTSPLKKLDEPSDGSNQRFGSYHQCYRLDDKLIAIGVIDLLPHCVSAVYFMYHESVHQYGFGKLSAMREIALAQELGYKYWYAGFYIHSCTKMKYKGDYHPQYILDPESYAWDLLDDDLKKMLDGKKYISLSRERRSEEAVPQLIPAESLAEAMDTEEESQDKDDSDENITLDDIPVYNRSMPGVLTKEQILNEIDLDNIQIEAGSRLAVTSDIISWNSDDMESSRSLKGCIAELAAAVGPAIVTDMVVKLS